MSTLLCSLNCNFITSICPLADGFFFSLNLDVTLIRSLVCFVRVKSFLQKVVFVVINGRHSVLHVLCLGLWSPSDGEFHFARVFSLCYEAPAACEGQRPSGRQQWGARLMEERAKQRGGGIRGGSSGGHSSWRRGQSSIRGGTRVREGAHQGRGLGQIIFFFGTCHYRN